MTRSGPPHFHGVNSESKNRSSNFGVRFEHDAVLVPGDVFDTAEEIDRGFDCGIDVAPLDFHDAHDRLRLRDGLFEARLELMESCFSDGRRYLMQVNGIPFCRW